MSDLPKIGTALLVDDEQIDQMMCMRVINRSGLIGNTVSFQYPDEALEFLKKPDRGKIDVLFLDVNMPRLNGFEFLDRAIAEGGPEFIKVVVVMLTTSLDPKDVERAASFQVVKHFINKPLTVEDLQHVASLLSDPG